MSPKRTFLLYFFAFTDYTLKKADLNKTHFFFFGEGTIVIPCKVVISLIESIYSFRYFVIYVVISLMFNNRNYRYLINNKGYLCTKNCNKKLKYIYKGSGDLFSNSREYFSQDFQIFTRNVIRHRENSIFKASEN